MTHMRKHTHTHKTTTKKYFEKYKKSHIQKNASMYVFMKEKNTHSRQNIHEQSSLFCIANDNRYRVYFYTNDTREKEKKFSRAHIQKTLL